MKTFPLKITFAFLFILNVSQTRAEEKWVKPAPRDSSLKTAVIVTIGENFVILAKKGIDNPAYKDLRLESSWIESMEYVYAPEQLRKYKVEDCDGLVLIILYDSSLNQLPVDLTKNLRVVESGDDPAPKGKIDSSPRHP